MNIHLIAFAIALACAEAYKILALVPFPGRSHTNLGDGVVRHLLKDGHEVTYISAFTYKPAHPNLTMVDVSDNFKFLPDKLFNLPFIMEHKFSDYSSLFQLMTNIHRATIENADVQKLLNNTTAKFDAVISEWLLGELPSGFAAVYDCPLIWISSMDIHWSVLDLIRESTNPAYTGDFMAPYLPPFTFWERAKELYHQLKVLLMRRAYYDIWEKHIYDKTFAPFIVKRGRTPPSYYDVKFNASLILGNSHHSMGEAISVPHNYLSIGGYHIDEDVPPLPENLQKIMDNAKNGVIYFSMGSNLKSKDMPIEIRDGFIEVFRELNQTVLWKYEDDLPDAPQNVHVLKWAPQHSILAHTNTVLFITHGGLLSTTETVHFGVPIIGIPVFSDQFMNIEKAVKRGFARVVPLSYTIKDELKSAIKEMTTNPVYTQKVKKLSFIYHDRTVPPGKEITHWVRHVIETGGALSLRSPGFYVPFYQKLYLDLFVVILVIAFVSVRLLKFCLKYHYSNKITDSKKKI